MPGSALALEYLALGWSIIPLKPGDKRPALATWKPYTKKRADSDTVRTWFQHDQNVAITGKISGFVVFDADADDALEDLELPDTVVAVTGGGGRHFYFKLPEGGTLPNRAGLEEAAMNEKGRKNRTRRGTR